MKDKKINYEFLRPIKHLSVIERVWFRIVRNKHLGLYYIQSHLEDAFLTRRDIKFPQKYNGYNDETLNDLKLYCFILKSLNDPSLKRDKKINTNSRYAQAVLGKQSLDMYKSKENYTNNFEKSKISFNKSLRKLDVQQLEFALKPAKKAFKLAPWYTLYKLHLELIKCIEKTDQIYTILSETLVLTRFRKRIKFYNLVKTHLDKACNIFNQIELLYLPKDKSIIQNCLSQINKNCIASIKKDQSHFNLDDEDSTILMKTAKLFQD